MLKIKSARMVGIEPGTGAREEAAVAVEDPKALLYLEQQLESGNAELEGGLVGWGSYTHTLFLADGSAFHVEVSPATTKQ